jgi:hypothetical protein
MNWDDLEKAKKLLGDGKLNEAVALLIDILRRHDQTLTQIDAGAAANG